MVALYLLAWLIADAVEDGSDGARYLIYYTKLSYIAMNVAFLYQAVMVIVYTIQTYCCKDFSKEAELPDQVMSNQEFYNQDNTPWYLKIGWLIYIIVAPLPIIVTIVYWGFVFGPSFQVTAINIHLHGIQTIIGIIDILVSRIPFQILHIPYSIIFISCYAVFLGIYYAAGGTNPVDEMRYVYPVLDYGANPGSAAGLTIALVVSHIPLFLFLLVVAQIRDQIAKRWAPCFWNIPSGIHV